LRDDFTRSLGAFALLGLCAISLRLAWGVSGEFPINLGAPAFAQQQGGCTPVTEITGRGNQESDPFEIKGQSFRVVFEADNPGQTEGYAFFNVIDENGGVVPPDSQNLSSDDPTHVAGDATFSGDPGSYSIEIASQEADYTINVEDCGGGGPAQGASQQTRLPQTGQSNKSRLLEAGGPTGGPVPVMPGGGCPQEYPVEKSGACHR
jgi:hypothetical protein